MASETQQVRPRAARSESKTGQSEIGWGREARAQGQRGGKVGMTSQASQLRKQFIADGREFVFALRALSHQLCVMLNHSPKLSGCLGRRCELASSLEWIIHLDAFLGSGSLEKVRH